MNFIKELYFFLPLICLCNQIRYIIWKKKISCNCHFCSSLEDAKAARPCHTEWFQTTKSCCFRSTTDWSLWRAGHRMDEHNWSSSYRYFRWKVMLYVKQNEITRNKNYKGMRCNKSTDNICQVPLFRYLLYFKNNEGCLQICDLLSSCHFCISISTLITFFYSLYLKRTDGQSTCTLIFYYYIGSLKCKCFLRTCGYRNGEFWLVLSGLEQ